MDPPEKNDIQVAITLQIPNRPRFHSVAGYSERISETLHPKLGKRRSSESDLPATDDEDDMFDASPVCFPSGRRRNRFQAYSCSFDYFIRRNGEPPEKTENVSQEEPQMEKSKNVNTLQIPGPARPRSHSATELSERSEIEQLKLDKSRPSTSVLPATDDEDEVFEDRPVYFSGKKRRSFRAYSCSTDYFTSKSDSSTICDNPSSEQKKGNKSQNGMLQLPVQPRSRSHSATLLSESSKLHHLNFGRSQSSISDLPATDDEDELFEDMEVYSRGRRRTSFQASSFSSTDCQFTSKTAGSSIKNLSLEKTQMNKSKKAMLQIPVQARPRSHSASELLEPSKINRLTAGESRTSASFISDSADEDDEVFDTTSVHFPNRNGRSRFQALSCSADLFTPRNGSLGLVENTQSLRCEKDEKQKSKQKGIQGGNTLQIPAVPRPRSSSAEEHSEQTAGKQHPKLGKRRSSESDATEEQGVVDSFSFGRRRSRSCYTSSDYFIHRSGKLTENAKRLSQEEIHSLEIDIFKPLDFYEILFERMNITNS